MKTRPSTNDLFQAVKDGRESDVRAFAQAGGNMRVLNEEGQNALMVAANLEMEPMLRTLLDYLPVDLKGKRNETPLMLAANVSCVELLLLAGADPSAFDEFGYSALTHALSKDRSLDVLEALVRGGCDPAAGTHGGHTPLMQSAVDDRADQLRALLSGNTAVSLERVESFSGQTALGFAFSNESMEAAKFLVEHGAAVTVKDGRGYSLLMRALTEGYEEMAHYALDIGVSAHEPNHSKETPLMMASAMDLPSLVERLLPLGVDVGALDDSGLSALDMGTDRCTGLIRAHKQATDLAQSPAVDRPATTRRM